MPQTAAQDEKRSGHGSFFRVLRPHPVQNGYVALLLLNIAVLATGLESAYVQVATTGRTPDAELFTSTSFLFLLCLDLLVPLSVALFSRRLFLVYLAGHCVLNVILLHYKIFFYNPLTLSTIYHSLQGAASLGADIFGFVRRDIVLVMGVLFLFKATLVYSSLLPNRRMPEFWRLRGITAVVCLAVIWCVSMIIYGKTGLSMLWVDSRGHTTATERRMETGTGEAVRNIGYVATWIGEWMSGTYSDTALIYAEERCPNPDRLSLRERGATGVWHGLPLPPIGDTVVLVQMESLDFAALSMKVNGHTVLPFIDMLAQESLVLKAFAPHKVGSSNSDYEILNGRVAAQNVIYYSYITEYPDSIVHKLAAGGYGPSIFHGLSGVLFNLRDAYAAQGFKAFFFKEELLAEGYGESPYIMEHILDADVFAKAAEEMDKGGRQAQFIITMSSHIPFIEPLPIFQRAGGVFARYVSSLRYLDQSLAAYYARLPAGTVLVVWGDHGSDVDYPKGFAENRRNVPFLVHVKGNTEWLGALRPEDCAVELLPGGYGRKAEPETKKKRAVQGMEALLYPVGRQDGPRLGGARVYTLCELAHYLRKMLDAQPQGAASK